MQLKTFITRGENNFLVSTLFARVSPHGWETMVFPCDAEGNVTDWCEAFGTQWKDETEARLGHDKTVATFQPRDTWSHTWSQHA